MTPEAVQQNDRALFTLKHVVRAVKSKRIVVETTGSSGGSVSTAGLSLLLSLLAARIVMLVCKAVSSLDMHAVLDGLTYKLLRSHARAHHAVSIYYSAHSCT